MPALRSLDQFLAQALCGLPPLPGRTMMHALDTLIALNARAAGREAAHAHNTGARTPDQAIMLAADDVVRGCSYAQAEERARFGNVVERAFSAGWNAGKVEG